MSQTEDRGPQDRVRPEIAGTKEWQVCIVRAEDDTNCDNEETLA